MRKVQNAPSIWSFYFEKPAALSFEAGDYVELSLADDKRWMTIAGAPDEADFFFTGKIGDKPTEYKNALLKMNPGDIAHVSPAIGTFNLTRDQNEKLLFVAAGVGITPFRSMLKQIELDHDHRDIALVYVAKADQFIFGDVLANAHIPIIQTTDNIDWNWIKKQIPDYKERICYFAGPQPLCEQIYNQALEDGVDRKRLMLDYFEGYTEL